MNIECTNRNVLKSKQNQRMRFPFKMTSLIRVSDVTRMTLAMEMPFARQYNKTKREDHN